MQIRTMPLRIILFSLGLIVLSGAVFSPAVAGPDDERAAAEVQKMKEMIHKLHQQAVELREAGKHDAARERINKAEKLEMRLAEYFEPKGRAKKSEGDLKEILQGLKHGIGALKALGKHDEAEHLTRIAKEVAAQLYGSHEKPILNRERGREKEREQARHQLEILRIAMHGLLEAERGDLAEKVEHLIHATELSLEGRRDKEARRIIETAPRGENMIEILLFAADKWAEFGHEEKAKTVERLARHWQVRLKEKHADRKREEVSHWGHKHADELATRDKKMAQLQAQLAEMTKMLKHLGRELEAMKREMR